MTGDYGGFRSIIDEARELANEERAREQVDCPLCGAPLDKNERGVKNCPLGHWRSDGALEAV